MIHSFFRNLIATIILFFISLSAIAASAWQIVPNESSIHFQATQNNAPVTGEFKKFTGDINFDPAQLSTSHIEIKVDINSITTSYALAAETLKSADWFDASQYPQAVFKAAQFTKTGDKTYQAVGTLTIRDKTSPITLTFNLEEFSSTKALVKGKTTFKRTTFDVGRGEWSKTDVVKDEVQVDFIISAVKK